MAAVDVGARNNPPVPTDDLDGLFDYSVPADIFQDVDTNLGAPKRPAKVPLGDAGKENTGGLGLDEEIKVTKKRAPIPKLDEQRLSDIDALVLQNLIETDYCHLLESPD